MTKFTKIGLAILAAIGLAVCGAFAFAGEETNVIGVWSITTKPKHMDLCYPPLPFKISQDQLDVALVVTEGNLLGHTVAYNDVNEDGDSKDTHLGEYFFIVLQ